MSTYSTHTTPIIMLLRSLKIVLLAISCGGGDSAPELVEDAKHHCPPCEGLFSRIKTTVGGKRVQNSQIQLRGGKRHKTLVQHLNYFNSYLCCSRLVCRSLASVDDISNVEVNLVISYIYI